ncbi:coenzyme F420-0:L-glutamate ligase / coenzyme F420-1:gamma-L-glutamate ligase [Pedococcus cremeus]|uniref:Coenzyme F420-0:L-glutamate ligase / coenzyme F420-1:gamma-L-glutamate ligase n=1 Tax=Pedococcus cremeus TaxID=587636 RepID=A0A1H9XBC5_9MICO|nr:coenzyme F420-0:L-glutamate ligase [Pedococcus cremeus]SES43435.1 coenzyme F420-0:L-glutamate ligase / coenzyme F420-1:gamma-L-glutamate ligase [Pedococcus cremeus]
MHVTVTALTGMPEVPAGADLAALLLAAVEGVGERLLDGDVLVVSSKVVSKALGLWAEAGADREAVIAQQTRRVVAERRSGDRLTRIVHSVAGPVMAAAGVDASNTGGSDGLLLLPAEPDAAARSLHRALLAASGRRRLGLVLSDTAGRAWRAGQVDFALGTAGLQVLDDLRGGVDADGRPLAVTARALADEVAAAADLVKGKAEGVPAALVRGLDGWVVEDGGDGLGDGAGVAAVAGAGSLVRTGREDWFGYGWVEAVRASLGVEPGSPEAEECGIPAVHPEPVGDRVGRAVRVALHGLPDVGVDVGPGDVRVTSGDPFELGRAVARLEVALWAEGLLAELASPPGEPEAVLRLGERNA